MTELLTATEMKALEQAAIDRGEVTGLALMERAGAGVVAAMFEEWPELAQGDRHAVVLCGPGNNGGDGFVVARLLKERGWAVEVFLYGDAERLPPDAHANYERWRAMGEVGELTDQAFDGWPDEHSGVDIMVDALFGIGLNRPFLGFGHLSMTLNTRSALGRRHEYRPKVIAVDMPSGMCADSGKWLGDDQSLDFAGTAHLTVSFHAGKIGHVLADGPDSCGRVVIKDIGL